MEGVKPPDPLMVDLWHALCVRSKGLREQLIGLDLCDFSADGLFRELVVVDTDIRRMRPWYEEQVRAGYAQP